jgi:hypothetical protein
MLFKNFLTDLLNSYQYSISFAYNHISGSWSNYYEVNKKKFSNYIFFFQSFKINIMSKLIKYSFKSWNFIEIINFFDLGIWSASHPDHIDTHQIKNAYQKCYSDQIRIYLRYAYDTQLPSFRLWNFLRTTLCVILVFGMILDPIFNKCICNCIRSISVYFILL